MKKKRLMAMSLTAVAAAMGAGAVGISLGNGGLIAPAYAADHDASHTMVEKTFFAPTTTTTGERAHWHCNDCCKTSAEQARYSYVEKTHVSEADITLDKLVAADAPSADDDQIATINTGKFKYVDQGADGVDGKEGTSTPCWVEDGGKTAIYFSRSNKAGDAYNVVDSTTDKNLYCSEFRFTVPESARKAESVSFSYKYEDWGTGKFAVSTASASDGKDWHMMCQFKDSGAYKPVVLDEKVTGDGTWRDVTIKFSESAAAGGATATTSLTDFIIKFVDLRGYIMVSGLSYELAPVTVALKNVTADNSADGSATVEVGSLPDAPAAISGKRFLGWYDESGSKVTAVTSSTTTLVAHWTVSHYTEDNEKLLKFTNNPSDYTTPEGVSAAFATRGDADIVTDINDWHLYPGTPEGSQGFYPGNDDTVSLGLGLPAFDFSKVGGVRFVFGFRTGVWNGVCLNGNDLGNDACDQSGYTEYQFKNFEVTIIGKNVSAYNNYTKNTVTFELDDDTYNGKKGLEITVPKNWGAWLFITPYVSMDCDYIGLMNSVKTSLPDEPASGYLDKLEAYSSYRDFMTEYEKTAYPISEKMQAWLDAAKATTKVLAFDDHGDSVYANLTGNSSFTAATYVNNYANNGYKDESRTDSLQFQILGLDYTYFTLTLPAFDFSAHAKVIFTMEVGGGPGDKTFDYWLGAIPDTANTAQATPTSDLLNASNYIGVAPSGSADKWDAGGTTVSIADGKITFSGLSSSVEGKTFDLDESINKGTTGLSITVGWGSYNSFTISPFYAASIN